MMSRRVSMVSRRAFGTEAMLPTAMHAMHKELGGKMVPFAGYELPVQYTGLGVKQEHLHCRSAGKASLFDVSHMGQIKWHGADRNAFLEKAVVGDVAGLGQGEGRLTLVTNSSGGILDDAVLANAGDFVYMVVNGACKHTDMAHFETLLARESKMDVQMEYLGDAQQLLALQGDGAKSVLAKLLPDGFDMPKFAFMTGVETTVGGYPCRVTRCGYTGEDGFEISMKNEDCVAVATLLLDSDGVGPCGLGARDSLRLEAGLCLYGHDLNETINPIEGTLLWTVGPPKSRRRTEQGFSGAEHMLNANGTPKKFAKKRVGFKGHKAPAREGAKVFTLDGATEIGVITSGTVSPCLGVPVAMGYVTVDQSKVETDVAIEVRGKLIPTKVSSMPFVETNYWRVPE